MTQLWTNTAQNPSRFLERDPAVARRMIAELGVPDCGHTDAMLFLFGQKSKGVPLRSAEKLTMMPEQGYSLGYHYSPIMRMTFRKDGQDLIQTVKLADYKVAKGYVQEICGVHLAYFPTCGNLAILEEWEGYQYRKWEYKERRYVPAPPTIGLFGLGLAGLYWIRTRKK